MPEFNPQRRRIALALPLLATAMFQRHAWSAPTVQRDSRVMMGTRLDITLQHHDARLGRQAVDAAFTEMQRLSDMMSRYRSDSLVSALQQRAGLRPLPVPAEMMAVLKTARTVSEYSRGAFDITVGAFSGWNFEAGRTAIPNAEKLARDLQFVNYRDLVLDEANMTAFLRRRGMRLDLGGIAKLPILGAGLATLERHGIRNMLINGGGDVLVKGQLQGRDWRIGVRDPRAPEKLLGVVSLNHGLVASSGDYERCFDRNGRRYHHILDPKTGNPTAGPHGVTLISRDLNAINGLGTAIMVAGSDFGQRLLASRSDVDTLIVERDRQPWMSAGMAQRLHA